jgi:hypothetical protein
MRRSLFIVLLFASPIPAEEPAARISSAVVDQNVFRVHQVESSYQKGRTEIRVLLPEGLKEGERCPVVYVLPVEAARGNRYGDGLLEVKQQGMHHKHRALFVAATFSDLPWYADHPSDKGIRQEMYFLKVVVPFIEESYPALAQADGRLLLGFSKSGWGAWSLLLRNPETFGRAAAWDAPLMMQKLGMYGTTHILGTQENCEKYRIAELLRSARLGEKPRLVLTGFGNFREHHQQAHQLMIDHKIPHEYRDGPKRKHDWHSGWVAEAVELLLPAQPANGQE